MSLYMLLMSEYNMRFQDIDGAELEDIITIIRTRNKLENAEIFDSVENVFC